MNLWEFTYPTQNYAITSHLYSGLNISIYNWFLSFYSFIRLLGIDIYILYYIYNYYLIIIIKTSISFLYNIMIICGTLFPYFFTSLHSIYVISTHTSHIFLLILHCLVIATAGAIIMFFVTHLSLQLITSIVTLTSVPKLSIKLN